MYLCCHNKVKKNKVSTSYHVVANKLFRRMVTKRITVIREKQFRQLAREVLAARKILLQNVTVGITAV